MGVSILSKKKKKSLNFVNTSMRVWSVIFLRMLQNEASPCSLLPRPSLTKSQDWGLEGRNSKLWRDLPRMVSEATKGVFIRSFTSLIAQLVKNPPAIQETMVRFLGWEDPLEKGKATHSSILAWRIPWTIVHGDAKSQTRLSNFHFTSPAWTKVLLLLKETPPIHAVTVLIQNCFQGNCVPECPTKEGSPLPKRWWVNWEMGGYSPGCPVVKTLPSNAEGAGSIPDWGSKVPHALEPKKKKYPNLK